MKITEIQTFLVNAAPPQEGGWAARNWLFVKVLTDEGIYGVGEASGWPRVVQTAVEDLSRLLVGEDPTHIERLWQKMMTSIMGHGMTGVVGFGAMTGVEMALWDLKGKALDVPVWNLLGGKIRDRVRVYAHAHDADPVSVVLFGVLGWHGLVAVACPQCEMGATEVGATESVYDSLAGGARASMQGNTAHAIHSSRVPKWHGACTR